MMSSVFPLALTVTLTLSRETWDVVNTGPCRTSDITFFSFPLSIPSLSLDPKPLVLIITSPKPHSADEQPLQTVNKQVSFFHEASSQKLIAPQKRSLPSVNSNYSTHGFLSFSNMFQDLLLHKSFLSGLSQYFIIHFWLFLNKL